MTICDFGHVNNLSMKNVMLSQHERYGCQFCENYIFCHSQLTVEIQFMCYLLPNNHLKRIDSQKIVFF